MLAEKVCVRLQFRPHNDSHKIKGERVSWESDSESGRSVDPRAHFCVSVRERAAVTAAKIPRAKQTNNAPRGHRRHHYLYLCGEKLVFENRRERIWSAAQEKRLRVLNKLAAQSHGWSLVAVVWEK